jgi:hypothetical protein
MKRISQAVLLLLLSLMTGRGTFAQVTSGNLVGTVKDASGSVVPGASVTVIAESTGVTTKVSAGSAGEFRAGNLLPDRYDVVVVATGFQKFDLKGVLVELNKSSTADITLTVGTAQSVEVSAEAGVVLDTTTTNLSQTFSNTEIATLPTASAGLGVLNLSLLTPGVASAGAVGIGTGPSVAGQRPRNNNYTIEGIDNNDKGVTGPLVYVPNDAIGNFTLITTQFSPEFGHSSGGQFNQSIVTGTNKFHGKAYEYFDNRNLNASSGIAGGKIPNPRYDFNRYGGQLGGPILKDKLFFFANFERQTTGQSASYFICTPTTAGLTALSTPGLNFSATNLAQYLKYVPAATAIGGAQVDASNDNACFTQSVDPKLNPSGVQYAQVYSDTALNNNYGGENGPVFGTATPTNIALGNYLIQAPSFTNSHYITTAVDYTISSKDQVRGRYVYNTSGSPDTAASLPVFYTQLAFKYHLAALSEFHSFTPNLTNEFRVGFNRYATATPSGPFSYPGLDSFPNLTVGDQDGLNIGPDGNAPQSTIQNLYQVTNNVSWVKGKHTIKIGFDGRKYISPQTFTQRVRGDYEWDYLTEYLHDLAPTSFGERSTGNVIYYGDQTALYGYGNDTWQVMPKLTLNLGLRYEFTSVPFGERAQQLNVAASFPGLINFTAPQPQYKNFAPRVGINFAPDEKTSVRAGFSLAYDVLFDNLGLLSFPPQYSSTNDVQPYGTDPTTTKEPIQGDPNFLAKGGLPTGGTGIATFSSIADQRAATSAYLPNVSTPYAESYTLTIQRVIASKYTAEIGYVGTRGIHLPTQDQLNVQPEVTAANQLFTSTTILPDPASVTAGSLYATIATPATANNLKAIGTENPTGYIVPAFYNAGFVNKITSYQPYSQSNYNGLVSNLTRTFQNGLALDLSYTWSKTMDDATAEVFATVLTPRRPQNSRNVNADYSRSALDRTHRLSMAVVYDLPYFKHSNFLMKNVVGNWTFSPIYTYESPEYATALSGINSNINGDSGSAIDRPIVNGAGVKGTGTGVFPVYSSTLAANCPTGKTQCSANLVGYSAIVPTAYYVQAGKGTLPTASRNTLPIRPIDNLDAAAYKRITFFDHYNFEFGAQAFNVLNHAEYIPGSVDGVNSVGYTSSYSFQTVSSGSFNLPQKEFSNNARSLQLSAKIIF